VLTIHNSHRDLPDFCWGIEGEIAVPHGIVCSKPGCGCDRAHGGLNSHRASTTLMVRNVDLDFDDLVTACVGYLEAAGWARVIGEPAVIEAVARDMVAEGAEVAVGHATGTVLRPIYDHQTEDWQYHTA
jgi:hypothetical protein